MVQQPTLEVLELRPRPPLENPRSQFLLEAAARELNLPPEYALQQALTHLLSCLQRRERIYVTLMFEPERRHNGGPGDA